MCLYRLKHKWRPPWLLILALLVNFFPQAIAQDDVNNIAVIANLGADTSDLNVSRLKSIFGMRTRSWRNGNQIQVFVLKDNNPLHILFTKKVLRTYPYNLRRIWDRRVYSGTGLAPTVVNSEQEMLKLISETDNAIGYISKRNIGQNVKVLEIR